jgi:hypothetical protein
VAVLWLARTGVVAAREVEGCRRDGLWSLTDRYWRRSRLRATLAALPARGLLFTNAPEACYLATGRYARLVPFRVERASEEERDEAFSPMREAVAGGRPVFLVWGWGWRVGQLVPLADVQARFRLRWTYWGRDGVVFRVSPRPP